MGRYPFDFQKKIVIYGNVIRETQKFLQFNVRTIIQFSQDSPTGEKIEIETNFTHRISKNWIFSCKETGRKRERNSDKPPRVITFKYHYHSKIIPKFMQKHRASGRKRSNF
jgi:hypothetical protein